MAMNQALLQEFDAESATTRKALTRVPDNKLGWKPHDKSMTMGALATHLGEIPGWMGVTLQQDSFDVEPPGGQKYTRPEFKCAKEIMKFFDTNTAAARAVLAGATDQMLMSNWTMKKGGKELFTMPKIAVVRNFLLNHNVHHRAQLGVYLRINDIPVPMTYGPSADEGAM